jgi:hypothetical protein
MTDRYRQTETSDITQTQTCTRHCIRAQTLRQCIGVDRHTTQKDILSHRQTHRTGTDTDTPHRHICHYTDTYHRHSHSHILEDTDTSYTQTFRRTDLQTLLFLSHSHALIKLTPIHTWLAQAADEASAGSSSSAAAAAAGGGGRRGSMCNSEP